MPESDPRESVIVVEYEPLQRCKESPLPADLWGRVGAVLSKGTQRVWWLLRLTLLGVALTPLVMLAFLGLVRLGKMYPTIGLAALILCNVAVLVGAAAYETRLKRRSLKSISAAPLGELESTLGGLVRRGRLYASTRACAQLLARLREAGRAGKTIYVCPQGQARIPQPIPVPFEHRALNEFDTAFDELRESVSEAWDAGGRPAPSLERRRVPIYVSAALLVTIFVGAPMFLIGTGVRANRMLAFVGLVTLPLAVLTGAARVLNMIRRRAARRTADRPIPVREANWRIANSAVVLATPGAGKHDWDLSILERGDSILVILQKTLEVRTTVIVGSSEVFDSRTVSPIELDMLLRAWLSPIPPPRIEQFSDWTGSGARP